jgi:hypothetical protein
MSASTIIKTAIGILILSIIVPIAFNNFFDVNTDSWDDAVVALWVIIPIAVIVLFVVGYFMKTVKGVKGG